MILKTHRWCKTDSPRATLLFLHGMGGVGSLWRPIAAGLEDAFEVLAFDQRGHGESRLPPDPRNPTSYTPLAYGRDVIETLKSLNKTSVWIIGHSMGVRTACAAAHLDPTCVAGLMLIDLGFAGMAGGGLGNGLLQFLKLLPESFDSRNAAREFMDAKCPDPAIGQYLLAVSQVTPEKRVRFPFDHGALIETIIAARDASVRKWMEAFAIAGKPALVLRGAKSLVWSHADFAAERAHFAQWPQIIFEEFAGAGHGLPFEKRPEFLARLREFYSSVE